MKNLEHIDEFFSDKLNNHEENVPPYIWDDIADKLDHKQKKKRLFYIQSAAASVAVLIAFLAGYFLTNNPASDQIVSNNDVQIESNTASQNNLIDNEGSANNNTIINHESTTIEKSEGITNSEANKTLENNEIIDSEKDIKDLNNVGLIKNNADYLAQNNSIEIQEEREKTFIQRLFNIDAKSFEVEHETTGIVYPNEILVAYVDPYDIEEEIIDNQNISKWLIGGSISPVYSYRNSSSSSTKVSSEANFFNDASLPNTNESGVISYAGGINVGYKLTERLKVYSGVVYSEIGQVASDVYINENQSRANEYLEINTSMGNIETNTSSYNLVNSVSEEMVAPSDNLSTDWAYLSNSINSKVYQYIEFVEVPLLLKYKLIDRRLDMHLLGGMSTSFVVGNQSLLEYDETKYEIGETENIQTVNYNSTVGLGVEYALNKKLSMSLEPTFKYALNSINTDYKVYPYSFAVFTGINYRF